MATKPDQKGNIRIFRNFNKKKPSHPDHYGVMVDQNGVEHDIALWTLRTSGNKEYWAGRVSNKEENEKKFRNKNNNQVESKEEDDLDFDSLPF